MGAIVRDTSRLYWTDVNRRQINSCLATGCAPGGTELAVASSFPTAIAISGSNLYWLEISSSLRSDQRPARAR
jgi:hypothetical protein